jgi:hypothetical protein
MTNDNKKYTDSDFDDFLKEKVDLKENEAPDDFDLFYSKLESTGFFEEKKTFRRRIIIIPLIVMCVGAALWYFAAEKDTVVSEEIKKEPAPAAKNETITTSGENDEVKAELHNKNTPDKKNKIKKAEPNGSENTASVIPRESETVKPVPVTDTDKQEQPQKNDSSSSGFSQEKVPA